MFQNHKCVDCSATGDVRLMPSTCHMEPVLTHPGSLVQYHPKPLEKFHDSATVVREHPKAKITFELGALFFLHRA